MFNMKKFADFLAAKRIKCGYTQGQLADRLGVTHQAVSKWERGETMPEISKISELSRALETSADEVFAAMHSNDGADEEARVYRDDEYYALPDKTLVGDVYVLAPYLSRSTLRSAIAEIVRVRGSSSAKLLFRFADEDMLREIAVTAFEADFEAGHVDLVPYLPKETATKFILNRYSSQDTNATLGMLKYISDPELVGMIFDEYVDKYGNWNILKPVIDKILPEVVIDHGIKFAVKHGLGCFNSWWHLLGRDTVAHIFIGYARYFGNNNRAWADIAMFYSFANGSIMEEAIKELLESGTAPEIFYPVFSRSGNEALPEKLGIKDKVNIGNIDQKDPDKRHYGFNAGDRWQMTAGSFDKAMIEELESRVDELESMLEELEGMKDELESRVEELEEMVEELEGRIDELESRIDELEENED